MSGARTEGPKDGTATPSKSASDDELLRGTFIVVPAFEEGRRLGNVLEKLVAAYPQVVVVDDGSRDDTYAVARRHAPFVLRHVINRGQGAALQTGLRFALRRGARWVVTFDADGQHQVEDVARLLAPLTSGECEITLGSRFLGEAPNLPATRRLILRLAILFTRLTSGARLTDAHNGLRAFTRRAAEKVEITMDRMAHASELIDQVVASDLPYREVGVTVTYSEDSLAKGQSSGGAFRIVFHYLVGRLLR